MSLNKTGIDWVKNPDGTQGYTWNPITGCLNQTDGMCKGGNFPCYAYRLANGRLKDRYLANKNIAPISGDYYQRHYGEVSQDVVCKALDDPFYPRFWSERLQELVPSMGENNELKPGKPKGIFVCDMSDLFGIGVPTDWTEKILSAIRLNPQHRFYLLTKQPQNLIKFSPFPDNCYVGVTATGYWKYVDACNYLARIEAKVRYISFEPLLTWHKKASYFFNSGGISWVIIGACTGTMMEMIKVCQKHPELTLCGNPKGKWTAQPEIEWVREIVEAADKAGVKVFLKDNLSLLLSEHITIKDTWALRTKGVRFPVPYRQEMPDGKEKLPQV